MISPAFNSNSGGGLTITYEFPGLCSMSATKNEARKYCSIPRKWLVYFRCKVSSVFSTETLKNTQHYLGKNLCCLLKINFIFDWQGGISLIIPLIMWPRLLKHYPADTLCILLVRTNCGKFNIRFKGRAVPWNNIEESLKCLTLHKFKQFLKKAIFISN